MKKLWEILKKIYSAETGSARWCKITVTAIAGIIGGAALLSYVVDPFYRYREPFFYDKVYYEIYLTAPALVRDADFDLFMLGTSMARNFFLSDIDEAFGCKSLKFAASGGTMRDLKKFFDEAVEAKQDSLKRVIFSLDIYPMNKPHAQYEEYDFMYEDGIRQEYRYLFSRKTYSSMIYLLKRKMRPKRIRKHQADPNRMFATEYKGKPYGLQEVIKDAYYNQAVHHTQTPYNKAAYEMNLHTQLLPMFDKHPQIRFTVYLPPYHIYTYCQSEEFGEADMLIRQRSEVMKALLKRPNVTLHDFQADPSYVCDHGIFSDVQHFNNAAARRVLADLVSGRRQIRSEKEVELNEQALRKLIAENMPQYYRHMQEFRRK